MKAFNADWITRLNAQHSGGLFFLAAVLVVGPGDTRRYADTQRPIVFDGQTYTPLPLRVEGMGQSSQQSLPTVKLTVPNITGEVGEFLETTDILGHDVTLQILHLDLLGDVTNQDSIRLQVLAVPWNDQAATFQLGLNLALSEQLPRHLISAREFSGVPEGLRRASIL